jgi:hypothetical protein
LINDGVNTEPSKEDEFGAMCVPQKLGKQGQNSDVQNAT